MSKHGRSKKTTFAFRFGKVVAGEEELRQEIARESAEDSSAKPVVPNTAVLLALAHHMEAQLQTGAVESCAQIAEHMGITRARVAQIMKLLNLTPEIQEEVLFERSVRITERHLRRCVARAVFHDQHRRAYQFALAVNRGYQAL